ncbi:DEAD/DEAH box helicase [Magnetofaba australis]|uniref:Putative Lhr-like helicase n=1 Tax=Magnetofaba australis IT-1 TaxID=1434232 RepID=A0A1Y2K7K5_9PROT|nr:DEAD/DEAH box helicase [Magnetofaba australis]OSM06740.1 putative Lhr-like helicase [Magnetofaba australis IT-1]
MSSFENLHPAVQHHIVNSLGWPSLRPLQESSIDPIMKGRNAILLAPTAGGKTEAAIFPIFSRMLKENWQGLSVLYICPIKALLNNLEHRLESFGNLIGRRVALWHGDVKDSKRLKIANDPPDILLATPESIEVILVSRRIDHRILLQNVKAVVIDEVHAFAGDDRGWHLLALLERLTHLTGRDIQRIGLSATVGNPEELLQWVSGSSKSEGLVINPPVRDAVKPDVQVDYVGNLSNAAIVISRLHRGEKRLVFCDSRNQVEKLSVELRGLGVETYVSHSSLSLDERKRAEAAFSQGQDCVIVATSTLELGIDVGDLDRVIQIDAPFTVSSFLQRIGRTGRRPGSSRNCLFLTTSEDAFLRAMGLMRLWADGYVEPITPPPLPFHILAQQIMALALQESGIGIRAWREHICGMPGFAEMELNDQNTVLQHMLIEGILFEDGGLLIMGDEGEATFGRRNFMELMSVFLSPPMFTILHGRKEIGQVHQNSFQTNKEAPAVLALAGQSWRVTHIDWNRHIAYVEPSKERGSSRWVGGGQPMYFELCQSVAQVLMGQVEGIVFSERGRSLLGELHDEFEWLEAGKTFLIDEGKAAIRWWTFAGGTFNAMVAKCMNQMSLVTHSDNYSLAIRGNAQSEQIRTAIASCLQRMENLDAGICGGATSPYKFDECLPVRIVEKMLVRRNSALVFTPKYVGAIWAGRRKLPVQAIWRNR